MANKGYSQEKADEKIKEAPDCGYAKSKVLPAYDNISPPFPAPYTIPPVTIKVPVELDQFQVQIDIETKIELEFPALEIKRIKKNLFVNQCKLILDPPEGPPDNPVIYGGKLFLGGYIRKNIEYATADCISADAIGGQIRHTTVQVPFECATRVTLDRPIPAAFYAGSPPAQQFYTFNCDGSGNSIHEQAFRHEEIFNEKIFCELIRARFDQIDMQKCYEPVYCHKNEGLFKHFTEKTALYITIKLLQNQQVKLNDMHPVHHGTPMKPSCDQYEN